jgi:hypothetical protein
VVHLIALFKTTQYTDSILYCRLSYIHLLEAPLKSFVLLACTAIVHVMHYIISQQTKYHIKSAMDYIISRPTRCGIKNLTAYCIR